MVRRMRWTVWAAALVAVMAAGACGKAPAKDADSAVQGLLIAAQAGDARGFEAAVDRSALRADLRRQLVSMAERNGVEVDGGPSDQVLDRMIGPEAVARAHADAGPTLKTLSRDLVCLPDRTPGQACLLTFARQKKQGQRPAGWRLVGMPAPDPSVQISIDLGG
jgi:hypothetical protein